MWLLLCWHLATIFLFSFFSFGTSLNTDEVLFFETFDNGTDLFSSKWIKSSVTDYKDQPLLIKAATTTIKGLDTNKGLSLSQANRHYGVSTKFSNTLDTKGRKEFVVQYDLKLENGLQCGGAYIKLLRDSPELDLSQLNGSTPYTIMFGPGNGSSHVLLTLTSLYSLTINLYPQLTHIYLCTHPSTHAYQTNAVPMIVYILSFNIKILSPKNGKKNT